MLPNNISLKKMQTGFSNISIMGRNEVMKKFSNVQIIIFVFAPIRDIEVSLLKIYLQQFSIEINLFTILFKLR
jgi:hypothetical protein